MRRTLSHLSKFPAAVGAGKKLQRFAALDDSDSDEPSSPLPLPLPSRPIEEILASLNAEMTSTMWGDLFCEAPSTPMASYTLSAVPPTEDPLWIAPFSDSMEMFRGSTWDTSSMTDAEWENCMSWLYANGWQVWSWNRQGFRAAPDNLPPRVWVNVQPEECSAVEDIKAPKAKKALCAAGSDTGRRRCAPRPLFCDGGERCKEGCPYVHGPTIPVMNKACDFGDTCSKRIVAVGLTPCCHLHPDEGEWNASMVRHRPTPSL